MQLPLALWAYKTIPHSMIEESLFRLAYGIKAMILVKIGEPLWRVLNYDHGDNESNIRL